MFDKDFLDKFITTQSEILTKLSVIETKIDDYKEVKAKCDTAYILSEQNKNEIEKINNKLQWISRTVIGAILTAIIGSLIALIKIK